MQVERTGRDVGLVLMGESRVVFLPNCSGTSLAGVNAFHRTVGGATALIAAACGRLGIGSRFVTMVGEDAFGDYLTEQLLRCGCAADALLHTPQAATAKIFVAIPADAPLEVWSDSASAATTALTPDLLRPEWFAGIGGFHCCVDALQSASSRDTMRMALRYAAAQNAVISMDVSLPAPSADAELLRAIAELEVQANLLCKAVPVGDASLVDAEWYRRRLRGRMKAWLLQVGDGTALFVSKSQTLWRAPLPSTRVDDNGVREAFVAAFLTAMLSARTDPRLLSAMPDESLQQWLAFAAAYAADCRSKRGALPALATKRQLDTFLRRMRDRMRQ